MDAATDRDTREASAHSDREPTALGLGLVRAFLTLLGAHVDHARDEAVADARRLAFALAFYALGALLFGLALVLGHLALVVELHREYALPWVEALASVALGDAVLAVASFLSARSRLAKPLLVSTRALVKKTVRSLTEP